MKLTLSYGTKMTSPCSSKDTMLAQTCSEYTGALTFMAEVCLKEWDHIAGLSSKETVNYLEPMVHATEKYPAPLYPFDQEFPNFPSYLRRAVICKAKGAVSSWKSNWENWVDGGKKGMEPRFPSFNKEYPSFYYGNMFKFTDKYGTDLPKTEISEYAKIKVWCSQRQLLQDHKLSDKERKSLKKRGLSFDSMVWDWMPVHLKTSDVAYLKRQQADGYEILCPILRKIGPHYRLQFAVSKTHDLNNVPVFEQVIVAVDLGINTPATCSVMKSDGTILARRFYKPAKDMGCLAHRSAMVSRAQSHGSRKTPTLWRMANNANRKLADGTADFILALAMEFSAHIIVFEHLELSGKKKGSKKRRLHHWRAKYIQGLVLNRAHKQGMRIARVCAWGTSKYAYDGSGTVARNINNNYSICRFKTGKVYNCDLSASYNIGARYFIREILKTLPAKAGSKLVANVPELSKRSTCTLSSLIKLNAELLSSEGGILPCCGSSAA